MQKAIKLSTIGKLELKKTILYYNYYLAYVILNSIIFRDKLNLLYRSFF